MSSTDAPTQNILIIGTVPSDSDSLTSILGQIGNVQVAANLEAAVSALQKDRFDLIVTPTQELLSTDQATMTLQLGAVLDSIDQGVGILDFQGRILWCNGSLNRFPEQVRDRIRGHCEKHFATDQAQPSGRRVRSLSLTVEEDRHFDVVITPLTLGAQAADRLVAVVSDVTRARRLQKKMDAIDNAGRELVRFDTDLLHKLDVRQRLALLEEKVLRYTRDLLDFDNFCIRLLDKRTNKLEIVLCEGLPPEAQQIDLYASTENCGISGYVASTGRSYICPDVRNDQRYLRGIADARSSLTVPLRLHDQVIGIFNIEARNVGAFGEDDRQFAEIFGRYVAIALHILDVLVVERHVTTGRLADDVYSEIAGPLGDILCDATTLIEDYIGHDDLRHRLNSIIDNVSKIKDSVKHVTRPDGGILGSRPKCAEADPLLDGKSVLVIDDEQIIRETVRDVLNKYGCEVETARDGEEAIAMVNRRAYDLVLSDIRLPGKDGYEIFRAARAARADCPVIFMTGFGYDPSHSIIRAEPEGLAAVLFKPFKVDELLKEVRAAITKRGQKSA